MKNSIIAISLMGMATLAPSFATANHSTQDYSQEYDSVSVFCQEKLHGLKIAYRQAELQSHAGNHAASVAILESALNAAAAQVNPRYALTITSKAIKRGVVLLNTLKATPETKQKLRTVNHFLFNYFLFIESVSNRLDIPYYQPHNGGYMHLDATNARLERLFVNFAQEQVGMVLSTMSSVTQEGRREIIYPIGSPTLLLSALKVTTTAMANDLSESIFAARYACTIRDLDTVSAQIDFYLKTKAPYTDEFVAVQELVGAVKHAVSKKRCGGYEMNDGSYDAPHTSTEDAIRGSFRLDSGTTQQVRLNGARYVKKLIISAEGVRHDAMFDVVVNGDVKGTIYVPGRDPSYFVTIEDYTDSIEFVSRNGNALITKILVVSE